MDLLFVIKDFLEHFIEIKIAKSFLTMHKQFYCSFSLNGKDIAEKTNA